MNLAATTLLHRGARARGVASPLIAATVLLVSLVGMALPICGAEPVPVNVRTAPGRFDISAVDATLAHAVSTVAEETWRHLAGVLPLPQGFSSPLFVRVGVGETGSPAFTAQSEPGGIVSIWINASVVTRPAIVRRALARGLLLRLGVAWYGADAVRAIPPWLELGCALWVDTRELPARLDAIKDRTRSLTPPALVVLLNENREVARGAEYEVSALWLLTFLQAEALEGREWGLFLRGVLHGTPADEVLTAAFPGRFANVRERELWWQTGWHHWSRMSALPMLGSQESAREIERLARFVFAPDHEDVVVPLHTVVEHAADVIVAGEFERRGQELQRLIPVLHPYYRNAGLSLLEVFEKGGAVPGQRRAAMVVAFEEDWRDGVTIEAAAKAALDALERSRR